MRRRLFLLATVAVLLLATPAAASAPGISVVVNGQPISAQAVVVNQSVYVPLRAVGESLGATVGWDGATNTATVTLESPAPVVRVVTVEKRVEVPVITFDAVAVYKTARTATYTVDWMGMTPSGLVGHLGSAFAVGSPSTVLTAYHVVEGASQVTLVATDGRRFTATVAAYDTSLDVALLKFSPPEGATALTLEGNPPDVGQDVGLISSPFVEGVNTNSSLTVGKVSRVDGDWIQADITGWEGSSGGVLLDKNGKVLGILRGGSKDVHIAYFRPSVALLPFVLRNTK